MEVESHPLRHMPLETVEITHKDGTSPKEITLDTGVIARNRTLKKISGDKWLSEPLKGWGENLEDDLGVTAIDISATGDASINVDGSLIEVKDLFMPLLSIFFHTYKFHLLHLKDY